MSTKVSCLFKGDFRFEADVTGHKVVMDADKDTGGDDSGPRPKPLLLAGLAGCTGMDVVSILRKMKSPAEFFNIEIEAESTNEHPMTYSNIKIIYQFKADDDLDKSKVEKAVSLSQERYCGVSAMLKKAADLTWEIEYL